LELAEIGAKVGTDNPRPDGIATPTGCLTSDPGLDEAEDIIDERAGLLLFTIAGSARW